MLPDTPFDDDGLLNKNAENRSCREKNDTRSTYPTVHLRNRVLYDEFKHGCEEVRLMLFWMSAANLLPNIEYIVHPFTGPFVPFFPFCQGS